VKEKKREEKTQGGAEAACSAFGSVCATHPRTLGNSFADSLTHSLHSHAHTHTPIRTFTRPPTRALSRPFTDSLIRSVSLFPPIHPPMHHFFLHTLARSFSLPTLSSQLLSYSPPLTPSLSPPHTLTILLFPTRPLSLTRTIPPTHRTLSHPRVGVSFSVKLQLAFARTGMLLYIQEAEEAILLNSKRITFLTVGWFSLAAVYAPPPPPTPSAPLPFTHSLALSLTHTRSHSLTHPLPHPLARTCLRCIPVIFNV